MNEEKTEKKLTAEETIKMMMELLCEMSDEDFEKIEEEIEMIAHEKEQKKQ